MRHTRAHTANRRSHHALEASVLSTCECGAKRMSHRACGNCGRYNGRIVVDLAGKAAAKALKRSKREGGSARSVGSKSEAQK